MPLSVPPSSPARRLPLGSVFVIVIALLCVGMYVWHTREGRETASVLTLYGNVDIRQVDVAFRVGGRIRQVLVDEGARVVAGQVLATLDTDLLEQAVSRTVAEVDAQQAQLALLTHGYRAEEVARAAASVREAAAQARNARIERERVEKLRASNAVSQKTLDNARAADDGAAARLRAAEEQRDMLTRGFREEDIARQRAALKQAEAALNLARIQLGDAALVAPQAGVVLTRAREAGAIVQAGQTVYTLSLVDPVWVRAYVGQNDLGRIKPGMAVTLEVDAAPGKRYPGTVGFVSPTAEFTPKSVETRDVRSALVYRLRVQAMDPDNVMRQGMPITVHVPLTP